MLPSDITDRILRQLSQRDGLTPEALEPLVAEYNREVVEANRRLADCVRLLREGLPSEAIQRANQEPNLIDWSSQLDFNELNEWVDIVQLLGLKAPTQLDVNAAKQIRDAVNELQPLSELLKRQRQLAIGKAPLAWRLKVLRAIRQLDNTNLVWVEDQRQWEIYRLKQIPRELEQARNNSDLARCSLLLEELESNDWEAKPDPKLLKDARDATYRLRQQQLLDELERIVDPFYAVYSEQNVAEGKRYYEEWNRIKASVKEPLPAEIRERVEPSIEWIEKAIQEENRQAEYYSACAGLVSLLDNPRATVHDLRVAYAKVSQFPYEVDNLLFEQLKQRVKSIDRRRSLKLIAIVSAVCILFAVAALSAFVWLQNQHYLGQVAIADEKLSEVLTTAQSKYDKSELHAASVSLSEANKFLKELDSNSKAVANHAKVKAHKAKCDQLANLVAGYEQQFTQMRSELLGEIAERKIPNDGIRLEQFKKLAGQLSKHDEALELVKDYEQARRDFQSSEIANEIPKFAAQRQAVEARSIATTEDVNAAVMSLDEIVKSMESFSGQFSFVEASTLKSLKAEITACETLKARLNQTTKGFQEEADYKQLILSSRDLSEYQAGLKSYTSIHSKSSKSADLKRVVPQASQWDAVEEFEQACKQYATTFTKLDPAIAKAHLQRFNKSNSSLRINSKQLSEAYPLTFDYLNDCTQRASLIDSLVSQLQRDVLASAKTLVYTQSNKQERGFLLDDEYKFRTKALPTVKPETTSSVNILSGPEREQTSKLTIRGVYRLNLEPSKTYGQVIEKLTTAKARFISDWENELLNTMQQVATVEELDYQAKLRLMGALMKSANSGSAVCRARIDQNFAERLIAAGNAPKEQVFGSQAYSTTMGAETVSRLRAFQASCNQMKDAITADAQKLAGLSFEFIGAVEKLQGTTPVAWLCKNADIKQGRVFALVPVSSSNSSAQNLISFGRLNSGRVTDVEDKVVSIGTPLFLVTNR